MASAQAPLLNRSPDQLIAHLNWALPAFNCQAGDNITVAQFLNQVWQLSAQLPPQSYAINLCANRYSFLLAFCAVIVRAQTNLLPTNRGIETQRVLAETYPDCYVLHDGLQEIAEISAFNIHHCANESVFNASVPNIDLQHLAAIAFTSGSTGEPQPNLKFWRTFVESTAINAAYMLPDPAATYFTLATVPGQHMWGLETSILMPLMAKVCIDDSRPLFPQDIVKRLAALPEPRLLVSTPVHLRAICLSGLSPLPVSTILCATAPLAKTLAAETEDLLQGQLREVFGCSEVGSMASRVTSATDVWQLFDGLTMCAQADKTVQVSAAHLPQSVFIQDSIELLQDGQFRLLGRGSDMLEIGGKRGSLLEMNKILQSHPQLLDAVVFLPEDQSPVQRLVAIVVATRPDIKAELSEFLRQRLDPVFIPRPIIVVDSLPREENGKLPRNKLLAFYRQLKTL